ncbi:MAG: RidA family protein [Fidelibacterota bacterium]
MSKKVHHPAASSVAGPYSPAVSAGDFVFTAGQVPLNPETGKLVESDFIARVRQTLDNVSAVLQSAGSSLDQAVKLTVFLTDLSRFAELNEVFSDYFPEKPPSRSVIQVTKLPLSADIEIECIAVRNSE